MKMTIEIPEDVLAEVMALTGKQTKREAVEYSLREAARRAKQDRVWRQGLSGLGLTPDQLAADAAPKPADQLDAPDIDEDAVRRSIESFHKRRARRAKLNAAGWMLNEPPPPPWPKPPASS